MTLMFTVTACGDEATTTDTVTDTSIAPLPREDQTTPSDLGSQGTGVEESPTTTASDDEVPQAAKVKTPSDYQREDQGAKEISAIPTFAPSRSKDDEVYLQALTGAGIQIKGVEDQLIGVAVEVCRARAKNENDVTLHAVAGQLVEQKRSRLDPKGTANAIASAASAAYCRIP